MTSKPLVFNAQHMLWQQRVSKERGTELRVKDEVDMHKTFTETLPQYLEKMDRKKQRHFRGAHPVDYHCEVESIATSSRSASYNNTNTRLFKQMVERRSQAGDSEVSHLSTTERLKAMSTRASNRLLEAQKNATQGQKGAALADILQENQLYEDVISQINRKLALRQAMDKASEVLERSQTGSQYGFNDGKSSVKQPSSLGVDVRSRASGSVAASVVSSRQSSYGKLSQIRKNLPSDRDEIFSNAGRESIGARSSVRATAHNLVDNLQVQLLREREQKAALVDHLQMLEKESGRK